MENKNITWSNLAFLTQDIIDKIDSNTPGAYRLSYKDVDEKFYVFFVGQSDDIKQSLSTHLSGDEENICVKNFVATKKCAFKYSKIEDSDIRQATLREAYKLYQPTCNSGMPDGRDDIIVNLL